MNSCHQSWLLCETHLTVILELGWCLETRVTIQVRETTHVHETKIFFFAGTKNQITSFS